MAQLLTFVQAATKLPSAWVRALVHIRIASDVTTSAAASMSATTLQNVANFLTLEQVRDGLPNTFHGADAQTTWTMNA
jgi:hypothetical protein